MKDSHRLRHALTYLAIIMSLSIAFSIVIYAVSVHEFNFGLDNQASLQRKVTRFFDKDIDQANTQALDTYKKAIVRRLAILNLGMLAVGTAFSFYLAKRNLEPLEEAIELQKRFSSDAAHELKTPLTAMRAENEVALRQKQLKAAEAKTVIESNLEEITKLEALIDNLLRLAQSGGVPDTSSWRSTPLNELVKSAIAKHKADAKAKQIKLDVKVGKDLQVYGDKGQLTELIAIILDNAVKYGKEKSTVKVRGIADGKYTQLDIADEGIGIKQEEIEHIFERFYRADQSRNKQQVSGYGLGLSLAQAIAKSHNAEVRVFSEAGVGTTFTIGFEDK